MALLCPSTGLGNAPLEGPEDIHCPYICRLHVTQSKRTNIHIKAVVLCVVSALQHVALRTPDLLNIPKKPTKNLYLGRNRAMRQWKGPTAALAKITVQLTQALEETRMKSNGFSQGELGNTRDFILFKI